MKKNSIIKTSKYSILLIERKGKNFEFLIDNDDVEKVSKYKWHIEIVRNDERYMYASAFIDGKKQKLHRYITSCPLDMVVDHINHNTLDNRKINLSVCSDKKNRNNRIDLKSRNNKSGVVGVYSCNNKYCPWVVSFKGKILGYFKELKDAIKTRKAAEKVYLMALKSLT